MKESEMDLESLFSSSLQIVFPASRWGVRTVRLWPSQKEQGLACCGSLLQPDLLFLGS